MKVSQRKELAFSFKCLNIKEWKNSLWWLVPHMSTSHMWGHYRAREPHVSCTWGAPLHHSGNTTHKGITVHVSHTWAVREGLPSTIEEMLHVRALPCTWAVREGLPFTIEEMLHVRALPCMWATRELYVRGSPPPLMEYYTWGHYRAREPHMSCMWGAPLHHWGNATREGITMHVSHTWAVCEGLPSTIEGMLHVRALLCTWATHELYVRGSPPPLRKCYTWGHYHAREPHMSCMWGAPSPPLRKCYTWGHYHACEPHVSCTWGAPLHHWGNATREGITVHVSHTWAVCEGLPLHHWGNATREGITMHMSHMWAVREGLPSTIEEMLHVRALPCTWATHELYVRGSPPPLRKCYTWGHYRACEPHVTHVYGHSSLPPSKKSDQKTARQPHR